MRLLQRARVALLCASVTLCACYSVDALPESRRVLESYFDELRDQDMDAVMARYHPSFFSGSEHSRQGWRHTLARRSEQIGAPQEYRLHRRKIFYGVKEPGAGTYVTLGYSVTYDRGTAEETFILFRASDEEPPVIIQHRLESTRHAEATPG